MLRRFFSYYRPYRGLFLLDFGCAVVAGLLELGFPLAVNQFVDKLLPGQNWPLILWACAALLFIYVLNTALQYVVTYWGHMLGINIETDMRRKLFDHIQKLSFRFFDNNKTGHLMTRITNDLNEIGEIAHHGPEDIFIAVMTLLGAFGLMLTINWKLAVLTFVIIPLMAWFALHFSSRMTRTYERLFGDVGEFNTRVENNIGGIRVVQAFANEEYEKELFKVNNQQYRLTKLLAYKLMAKSMSITYMMMRLVSVFVMIAGTWFVIRGELSYGEFVGFLLLSNVFFRPIEKINAVIESYPKGIAGFKRYCAILDTEPDVADAPDAVAAGPLNGDIVFRSVSFGYDGSKQILKGLNLSIRAGETVAFVGPSGAGKTTICSLLPRFYECSEGSITIDGMDIRRMTLQSLRSQIGIVQQEVYLFEGTIRQNIAYGKLDAGDEEIWEAARRAQLEEFIRKQPDGMQTQIGERGVKLSGGQKQRLAIARMFLKNPPILILDEATSALDTATELAIQQSLAELSAGRTTLVIAHRLATIKNADRIIVVTEDGVAEEGAHQELVAAGGMYSRLHQAQFGT
ncbi:ABC transporter ATP-binding protein [Paenibacillus mucilaginosus]|uniref:YwjA n=1 Tax=Paenibacillus mucilaginosus 3016 TaxID=1116391 RepID=H6NNB8_9BACL|nr:ABC transporter ATP-binding protein [Paenibacillus mucilaginosus]AFC32497.1 YwjA [Paenibacillus mucilaginosus 3016]MCG7218042.1 ABC transporter ATP-binding protein/permease [Paenibacillus mucilaginosus]WDM26272.1 ABC transporter ATP-binding protein [Paenibacillus mucilaginosus]WFA20976.1 ABC transporter ATP-binding protein [Paenibacillus mucilaginosus]